MKLTAKLCRWLYNYRHLKLMLGCMFLTGLPVSAYSADLPTSQSLSSDWIIMHPSTFTGTTHSAFEQCARNANVNESDALTLDLCRELERKISENQCSVVQVPDGIIFDYLNGRSQGQSVISFNKRKATGRDDRALLCSLGNGVHAYWFTGVPKQSCNNIAIVLPPKPVATIPSPKRAVCRIERFSNPVAGMSTPQVLSVGVVLPGSVCLTDIAGATVISSGIVINDQSTLKSSGYTEICEEE